VSVFLDARAYARTANVYAAAVHRRFPRARIAAVGASRTGPHEHDRMRLWNSQLFSVLDTTLITALTLHP
jgi:hypothetical protein